MMQFNAMQEFRDMPFLGQAKRIPRGEGRLAGEEFVNLFLQFVDTHPDVHAINQIYRTPLDGQSFQRTTIMQGNNELSLTTYESCYTDWQTYSIRITVRDITSDTISVPDESEWIQLSLTTAGPPTKKWEFSTGSGEALLELNEVAMFKELLLPD